ncbi:hypothetical protein V8E54_000939 [Elaphomyces granulatus]
MPKKASKKRKLPAETEMRDAGDTSQTFQKNTPEPMRNYGGPLRPRRRNKTLDECGGNQAISLSTIQQCIQ